MSRISEDSIKEILDKADALTLFGDYVQLEKKGGRYWGLCPFHNEKTASFSVDPDKKFYYCFGCNKGGGFISFIMEMEKLSYPEALEFMAKRLGIQLQYEGASPDHSEQQIKRSKQSEFAELYRRVSGTFHHFLKEHPAGSDAKKYLLERSISVEMIDLFKLGYAPGKPYWLYSFLQKKGYSTEFLGDSGLFSRKNPKLSFFTDRLIFPINDRRGKTVAFGGRILHGEGPKYLNSSESDLYKKRETLYAIDIALPEIRKTKEVYLCEGYMDVIAMHQADIHNTVAPLGTAFTDEQAQLLHRWAERVYLVFDNDDAGQRAAVKGILCCRRAGIACSVVEFSASEAGINKDFKDPADILKEAGPEALQKSAKCFINDFDYLLRRARDLFDINDSEGSARAVAFLFPYLETLDSEVAVDGCVGRVADAFGVDRVSVLKDFRNRHDAKRLNRETKPKAADSVIKMNDELFLLIAVVVNRDQYIRLRSSLSVEEVDDPRAKEIFIALEECFRNDFDGMDAFLSRISDDALKAFILEKGSSEAFSLQADKLVADGIMRVKEKRLERRRTEIVLKLRSARDEGYGTERELDSLLSEKMHIDAELRRIKEDHE